MRCQDQRCEERKSLQKICCRLIDAIGETAQRRHGLFSVTGSPTITVLKADEMGRRDQMQKTQDHASRQKP